jgi:hypothetical protein
VALHGKNALYGGALEVKAEITLVRWPARQDKAPKMPGKLGRASEAYPVDLTTIPGLNVLPILTLVGEIGTNMAKWRNEKAFVSWLGLSPNNKISGQRVLSSK